MRYATIGVCVIVLFVGTGTGVYAYESPDVIEGHPLYGMKQGIENVEGRFAFRPEQKIKHQRKMMRRRVLEALRHAQNPEEVERILNRIPPEARERVLELLRERKKPPAASYKPIIPTT